MSSLGFFAWNRRTALRVAALSFVIATGVARAVSFDYAETSDDRLPFNPGHFVFDGSGAWVTGSATARFRTDGSLAFVASVEPFGGDALLAETADGGVAEAGLGLPLTPYVLPCSVLKLDANGARQWSRAIDSGASCMSLAVDGDATLWIATEAPAALSPVFVYRIGADGSGFAQVTFPTNFIPLAVTPAPGAGAYVAGYLSGSTTASIVALDGTGAVAWQWTDIAAGVTLTHVAVDAAGNICAAGYDAASALVAVDVDHAGASRWNAHLSAPGVDRQSGFALASDGTAFALVPSHDQSHRVVEKINADGTLAWQSDVPVAALGSYPSWLDQQMGLRLAPNGDILVLANTASGTSGTTTLVRFDASGHAGPSTTLTGRADASSVDTTAMTALADSSALISTRSDFTAANLATLGSPASDGMFVHVDASGEIVSSPFASAQTSALNYLVDALVADDGTTYVLTNNLLGEVDDHSIGGLDARYALSAISATGVKLWKVEHDGYLQSAQLVAGDGRACIVGDIAEFYLVVWGTPTPPAGGEGDLIVECHDAASGATRWSTDLQAATTTIATIGGASMLDAGLIAVGYLPPFDGFTPSEFDVATVDASGAIAATHTVASQMRPYAMGADGSTLLAVVPQNADASAMLVRADGSTAYNVTLPNTGNIALAKVLADDNAEIVALDASGDLVAKTIAPAGTVQSTTTLATGTAASTVAGIALTNDAANAYVTLVFGAEQSGTQGAEIFNLARADGTIAWHTTIDEPLLQAGIVVDPSSGALVLYSLDDYKTGTRHIDLATGFADVPTYRDCGGTPCIAQLVHSPRITADGALRYALDNSASTQYDVALPQVFGIDDIAANLSFVPVAQSGVTGAWYATYAPGQGFTIDFFADSGTLFMPWFTYTVTGGNDPSSLAWYSLQGQASSTDTSALLTIYASSDGAFASGTTTPATAGTAALSFTDCNHGSLAYQFFAGYNNGAQGTITLTRLTPATADCTLADGSTTPAGSFASTDGFDTSDSGSWYDPATSGQGIEFTVVPSSSTNAGLLFGAWFTYAPAGDASAGATKQHWFTLQGDLSHASNGQVTVPIFSTVGGSLDAAPGTTTLPIGQATVTFANCSATVHYQFDDSSLAHAYRGLDGTLNLVKLSACQ